MSKISELSDGGVIQGGDTLIAVRSGGNVKVTYGGSTTANIDGGTIDGTVIGGATPAAVTTTALVATTADINAGTIDGTVIGGSSAAAGSFTTLTTSGNVGIGTSSPQTTLDLGPVSALVGPTLRLSGGGGGGAAIAEYPFGTLEFFSADASGDGPAVKASIVGVADTASSAPGGELVFSTTLAGVGNSLTERARIDSAGNVGIGTSSPVNDSGYASLTISDTTGGQIVFQQAGTTTAGVYGNGSKLDLTAAGARHMQFNTNGSERMRIDSSGNVGIGVAPSAWRLADRALQIGNTMVLTADTNVTADVGYNYFINASNVQTYITNAPASYYRQYLGAHTWYNAPSGTAGNAVSFTQAMTLDASGNLLVGKTSTGIATTGFEASSGGLTQITNNGASPLQLNRLTSDGNILNFFKDGTTVGTISVTASATAYNTSSDERLKENITDAPAGNIDDIKVRSFDWKADGSHQDYGMVAQELEAVAPYAVTKGETEDDMWSVDYSKLVPMLIKEIQDLKAEVAALKGA